MRHRRSSRATAAIGDGLLEAGLARLELGEFDAAQELFARAEALFEDVQEHHVTPARAELWIRDGPGAAAQGGPRHRRSVRGESRSPPGVTSIPKTAGAGEAALWLGRAYLAKGRDADAAKRSRAPSASSRVRPLRPTRGSLKLARATARDAPDAA